MIRRTSDPLVAGENRGRASGFWLVFFHSLWKTHWNPATLAPGPGASLQRQPQQDPTGTFEGA